jgi:hypothetical protein
MSGNGNPTRDNNPMSSLRRYQLEPIKEEKEKDDKIRRRNGRDDEEDDEDESDYEDIDNAIYDETADIVDERRNADKKPILPEVVKVEDKPIINEVVKVEKKDEDYIQSKDENFKKSNTSLFTNLYYKFSDLSELKTDSIRGSKFKLTSLVNDDLAKRFNSDRYDFYTVLLNALESDPETVLKVSNEINKIKSSKLKERKIIESITSKLNKLYLKDDKDNVNRIINDKLKNILGIKANDKEMSGGAKKPLQIMEEIPEGEEISSNAPIDGYNNKGVMVGPVYPVYIPEKSKVIGENEESKNLKINKAKCFELDKNFNNFLRYAKDNADKDSDNKKKKEYDKIVRLLHPDKLAICTPDEELNGTALFKKVQDIHYIMFDDYTDKQKRIEELFKDQSQELVYQQPQTGYSPQESVYQPLPPQQPQQESEYQPEYKKQPQLQESVYQPLPPPLQLEHQQEVLNPLSQNLEINNQQQEAPLRANTIEQQKQEDAKLEQQEALLQAKLAEEKEIKKFNLLSNADSLINEINSFEKDISFTTRIEGEDEIGKEKSEIADKINDDISDIEEEVFQLNKRLTAREIYNENKEARLDYLKKSRYNTSLVDMIRKYIKIYISAYFINIKSDEPFDFDNISLSQIEMNNRMILQINNNREGLTDIFQLLTKVNEVITASNDYKAQNIFQFILKDIIKDDALKNKIESQINNNYDSDVLEIIIKYIDNIENIQLKTLFNSINENIVKELNELLTLITKIIDVINLNISTTIEQLRKTQNESEYQEKFQQYQILINYIQEYNYILKTISNELPKFKNIKERNEAYITNIALDEAIDNITDIRKKLRDKYKTQKKLNIRLIRQNIDDNQKILKNNQLYIDKYNDKMQEAKAINKKYEGNILKIDREIDEFRREYDDTGDTADLNVTGKKQDLEELIPKLEEKKAIKCNEINEIRKKVKELKSKNDNTKDTIKQLNIQLQDAYEEKELYDEQIEFEDFNNERDFWLHDNIKDFVFKPKRTINSQIGGIINDETEELNKIKKALYKIDDVLDQKSILINKQDRFIFILITFFIRLIALTIIEWALITNYIVNFFQAYLLYLFIYILLFILIIIFVNISYDGSYDSFETHQNNFYIGVASSFYYFYFIPGNFSDIIRIAIHIGIILVITGIALIIKNRDVKKNDIDFDYTKKKNINKSLNDISLIIWVFTSLVALKV